MSLLTAFFIYILIWWVMLFTVLPLGVVRHGEQGRGFDPGAPIRANLQKKLILNTALSAVILGIVQVLVVTGLLDWRGMFEGALK